MRTLEAQSTLPWSFCGDFNELVSNSEKLVGFLRPEGQIEGFRDVIAVCGVLDLPVIGSLFTWSRR